MDSSHFDVVTVGGGLGASALAAALANGGMRVLVLERETQFKDRVRGEYIVSWGVAEARELGIDDMLLRACGAEIPFVEMGFGARNLVETTPQRRGGVSFFHPDMQRTLLDRAEHCGATVRRGANVTGVSPGSKPAVRVDVNGREEQISARIVVVADGRGSAARKWLGFALERDECPFHFAGVSLGGVSCQEDKASFVFNPEFGLIGAVVPQKNGRFRAYLGYPADGRISLNGAEKLGAFVAESRKVGPMFADCYAGAKALGPLAAFEAGYFWVDHPYREGVALIGEAAATSDPSFGQGMALTLRDVRVLRDALQADSDWDRAGHRYAEQHDRYFQNIRTVCCWFRNVFQEQGPAADARRQFALPRIVEDLSRVPDHLFGGPELPLDEKVRARFFGEC